MYKIGKHPSRQPRMREHTQRGCPKFRARMLGLIHPIEITYVAWCADSYDLRMRFERKCQEALEVRNE